MTRIALGLAALVSVLTLATSYNVVAVIPYKIVELEKKDTTLLSQIEALQKNYQQNRELLVRIDERLAILQGSVEKRLNEPTRH